ncbi:NAD-dependent epimerase/dehydratase family protein [Sphingobium yanoikuyae]|uniref:Epimerase n=1 Tax=Sphingobium yanoikuyae TaxID=13690 RepID=A0A291N0R0_SPHYA|nr:NAD(P)-dependent oxidoreductase [Sphingobium yanoikuyae]ATI80795.1 epimerase [Sphingobium yanoikuyae]
MTILLTGATGLVGSRLLPRLLAAGHQCRVLVRGGKAIPTGAEAVSGDLFDPASLASALEGVSAIIHLAAVFRTKDEALIWKSNRDGARNLIAAAETHAPQARFILASTSNVYGKDQARPGREDDAVDPPQAYPASKVAAERALSASQLNRTVLRFPFVYGDGDGHLAALPGHAASAGWHPAMRMSTIHHRDIATAMALALEGRFDGRVINIADDLPASMLDLIALGGGDMGASAEPLTSPWALQVDTALARSMGFQPTVRTVFHAAQEQIL